VHQSVPYVEQVGYGDLDVLLSYEPSYGGYMHALDFIETDFKGQINWSSLPGCWFTDLSW
jgi:hypothetical protein